MRGVRVWLSGCALIVAVAAPIATQRALADGADTDAAAQAARLVAAKRDSAAAAARSHALDRQAAAERGAAGRAAAQEAAVAARVDQAQADIVAAGARIALIADALSRQRAALGVRQAPIARLLAALESLAVRPAVVAVAEPGSVDDLVHVRAVLGTVAPAVRARTAALRETLQTTRNLQADQALALAGLVDGRRRLDGERLALARLEAVHRQQSAALGRSALVESDRAIGLGEEARELADQMTVTRDATATAQALATLGEPLPRPLPPGEMPADAALFAWPEGAAPYALPVAGRLVTGLGEVSDAGVRARGLTFAVEPDAAVTAPAAGRIAYAHAFRGYGNVVIIDHGDGWTTLLTGLGPLAVARGQRVGQGAAIGQAPDGGGSRIGVELRRQGVPMDMTALIA